MSDPQPPVGEPIEEPSGVDDVVGSANEGLSHAEAARTGAASGGAPVSSPASAATTTQSERASEPASEAAPAAEDAPASEPAGAREPAAAPEPAGDKADARDAAAEPEAVTAPEKPGAEQPEPATPADRAADKPAEKAAEPDPWDSPEAASLSYTPEYSSPETVASTAGAAPVTANEPAVAPAAAAAAAPAATYPAHQPIFVQAPEAPRPRGNRGAAGAIGLVAAASFAVLYLAVWFATDLVARKASFEGILDWLGHALATWTLWVPVVVFFLAFWLLGAIINRGRWGLWVIFGLLVGFVAYGGYLLGLVCQAPFWMVTASEARRLVETHLFTPLAIGSFIIARELTIWFGAWVAARGRKVTLQNLEAQREYERTLEAGPQLHVP